MQGKGRALVSVMAANNETGVVQTSIAKLVKACKAAWTRCCTSMRCRLRDACRLRRSDADYMTLSAHKLGGPQGAGALIVKDGAPLRAADRRRRPGIGPPRRHGKCCGHRGLRCGRGSRKDFAAANVRLAALRDRFETKLKALAPDAVIFGANAPRLANTSNFAIPGLAAETALIALDLDGVAVSVGRGVFVRQGAAALMCWPRWACR